MNPNLNDQLIFCDHNYNCGCSNGTHSYIPYYQKLLDYINPVNIFEWGPGKNTEIALRKESVKKIISIEQDKKWIPDIVDKRSCIIHCKVESDFYVNGFVELWKGNKFDLFFIDSRKRSECLNAVYDYSINYNPSIIVCLHDAQRSRYKECLFKFKYVHFLHKGFAVATLSEEIFIKLKNNF